jgi:peptidoglycan-N-acetylglucosamine deacetylase
VNRLRRRNRAATALLSVLMIIAALLFLWMASKATCWQLVGDAVCRIETREKIVALSFDDGPTREGVDALLPVLRSRGVKATFFLIGKQMRREPGQAERLVAAGHELGNHSFDHQRMIGRSTAHYAREIADTNALLQAAGQQGPKLFRPPFGRRLVGLPLAVEAADHQLVMWDVADRVVQFPDPQSYAKDIVNRVRPGSIILIHPMYRGNSIERAAVPLVIDALQAKGYQIVTIGALLQSQGGKSH